MSVIEIPIVTDAAIDITGLQAELHAKCPDVGVWVRPSFNRTPRDDDGKELPPVLVPVTVQVTGPVSESQLEDVRRAIDDHTGI